MPKPLAIIGLDPGTTAAYTLLDLEGHLLQSYSAKELSLSRLISRVISLSQPLVTSTDKGKTPFFVQKFSSRLGTLLIAPPQDLKKQEKKELTAPYPLKDSHQADSLAAALFAYKKLKPTLLKINDFILKNALEDLRQPFTQLVLKENLNFDLVKNLLTSPGKEGRPAQPSPREEKTVRASFLSLCRKLDQAQAEKHRLFSQISELKKSLFHLQQTNTFLAKKLAQHNQKIDLLLSFKEKRIRDLSQEISKKEKENSLLLGELVGLKELFFDLDNKIVIRKVKDLGNSFRKKNFKIKEGDCLFVGNPHIVSGAVLEELKRKGVKLFSRIRKKGIFVLDEFLDLGSFIIVNKDIIKEAISKRDILGEIMEEYRFSQT